MIESVITVKPFRFWCQKVLPLVYDDSLSYYELLCKVVDYINGLITDDTNVIAQVNELTTFVNDYFTNLDVQEEINNKLDAMVDNGQLDEVISHYVDPYIAAQNANIEAFKTTVNSHLAGQDSDINVLEARMDTFASLPTGSLSTDADAELVDIRVGADGTTYSSAGNAVRGQVSDLKTAFQTCVTDRYDKVVPSNWFNPDTVTYGELNKDGTVTESENKIYTDFIPVDSNSIIQCFRSNPIDTIYRRHIAVYDYNKNILPSYGSDNSSLGTYTIALLQNPNIPKYVRITVDATAIAANAIIVTDGTTPTAYTPYFEPYIEIADDFLTPESETALEKLKNNELTTADLVNSYACALPKGYIFRQTVGLPEKWYYASAVSPLTPVSISAGSGYSQRENDGISFPNNTALNSANGYTWNVYDSLLALIEADGQNVPYGMDRRIVAENLQDCTMLVIGDSTVDHDVMTQKMLDYFTSANHTLTLLGTLGSGANRNEGRSGWKATDYLTNKQYNGVVNPFYNSAIQNFDFAYYMTNQGYGVPNFVVIQLGINDLYNYSQSAIEPAWNAVKTMIDSILSYNANIKILLNLPTAPNSNQALHTVFLPAYNNRVVKYNAYAMKQARALYGQTKVRPTYCHLILDPNTDISDNVHPTAAGYEKMAKEIINQVNCWLNNA